MPLFVRYEKSSSDAKRLLKKTDSPQMAEALRELSNSPAAIEAAMDEFLHNADDGKWFTIYAGRRLGPPDEDEEINFIPDAIISLQSFDQVLSQRKGVQNADNAVYAPIMPLGENEHKNSSKKERNDSVSEDASQQPFTKEDKKLMLRRVWVPAVAGLALLGVGVAYAAVQMNSSLQQNQYTMPPISQQASGNNNQSASGTFSSINPSGSSSSSGGSGGGSSSPSTSSSGSGSSSTQSATTQPASQPQSNSGSTQSSTPAPSQPSNNSSSQSSSTTAPAASSTPSTTAPTSSSQPTVQSVDWSQIASNAAPSVVKVVKVNSLMKYTVGTGFFVYNNYVVTDYHVVRSAGMFLHVDINGAMYPATLIGHNTPYDLALLQVSVPQTPLIGASGGHIGEDLIYMGYALGNSLKVSNVHALSAINQTITLDNGMTVQGECEFVGGAEPGQSGGPLLDANGHVIGMIDNSQTAASPSTYGQQGTVGAIQMNAVDSFLQNALPNDLAGLQQNGY